MAFTLPTKEIDLPGTFPLPSVCGRRPSCDSAKPRATHGCGLSFRAKPIRELGTEVRGEAGPDAATPEAMKEARGGFGRPPESKSVAVACASNMSENGRGLIKRTLMG